MPYAIEAFDSRKTKGDPPSEATFKYTILQCQDEEQAVALVYGKAPVVYRGLSQDRDALQIEKIGFDSFLIELPYFLKIPPDGGGGGGEEDPTGDLFEFDATGGTQHITQCISQIEYGPEAAPNIAAARVLNLTRDGVEGTDIEIGGLTFSVNKKFPVADVLPSYIKNLSRLKPKINAVQYVVGGETYAAGELLFMGAVGRKSGGEWDITYRFAANENRANIAITPAINVPSKRGWDYLWVQYHKNIADNEFVEVPLRAWVSKVYEEIDFALVLGF